MLSFLSLIRGLKIKRPRILLIQIEGSYLCKKVGVTILISSKNKEKIQENVLKMLLMTTLKSDQ